MKKVRGKIALLPPIVANQIAAGEVIQRPASAVKELLENSLDAGSTVVKILVEEGGKKLIQVIDNGSGMTPEDLRICYHPHATSKMREVEDLYQLKTYGFRGEALNAIAAAAAKVEIMSRRVESAIGHKVVLENGIVSKEEAIAMPEGTQIRVHHLFGNIPARLHFLKSNTVEMHHIIATLQRTALARRDVTFSLYNKKEEIVHWPATKLSHRIVHMLGKKYQEQLLPCEERTQSSTIRGYVGTPQQARKGNKGSFFFVNNRYIKSSYLHHAVKKAFESLIKPELSPFYVLFIDINPAELDVNIHPTKTEVKFEHEKIIYTLVSSSVRKALGSYQMMPSIDFDTMHTNLFSSLRKEDFTPATPTESQTTIKEFPSQPLFPVKPFTNNKKKESEEVIKNDQINPQKIQIKNRYIIAEVKSGLLLIDQEAAYERILYQRNKDNLTKLSSAAQQTFFASKIELSIADLILVKEARKQIESLGFRFEVKEDNHIAITGQPAGIEVQSIEDLFLETIEEYKKNRADSSLTTEEKWARALAKKAKHQFKKKMTLQEINQLVNSLFDCDNPNYTVEGKPIWRILGEREIANIIMRNDQ
ncbi:MAG: DNA mismatch repair endonuclease MutL [Bacteroidota bacterium]